MLFLIYKKERKALYFSTCNDSQYSYKTTWYLWAQSSSGTQIHGELDILVNYINPIWDRKLSLEDVFGCRH